MWEEQVKLSKNSWFFDIQEVFNIQDVHHFRTFSLATPQIISKELKIKHKFETKKAKY